MTIAVVIQIVATMTAPVIQIAVTAMAVMMNGMDFVVTWMAVELIIVGIVVVTTAVVIVMAAIAMTTIGMGVAIVIVTMTVAIAIVATLTVVTLIHERWFTMKILINDTEMLKVASVTEKLRNDGCVLDIQLNDSTQSLTELKDMFDNINSITIIREDLNGEEKTCSFDQYTKIDNIKRRLVDATDITTITLISDDQSTDNGEAAE